MSLYRECRGGGDVTLDYIDGRWEVVDMVADVCFRRRHRFWIIAFIDWLTT